MKKLLPALATSLGVVVALAAFVPAAQARDGARFGGFGNFGPVGRDAGFYGERPNFPDRPNWNNRNNFYPWVDVGSVSVDGLIPENNSGSSMPNDCNYLFKKATDTGDSSWWRAFNDCSHGR